MTPLQLLFSFEGRVNRAKYIAANLAITLASVLLVAAVLAVTDTSRSSHGEAFSLIVMAPVLIVMLWSSFATAVKRIRDTDNSAWWLVLSFVPIASLVLSICLLVVDGTRGSNRFGEDVRDVRVRFGTGGDVPDAPAATA